MIRTQLRRAKVLSSNWINCCNYLLSVETLLCTWHSLGHRTTWADVAALEHLKTMRSQDCPWFGEVKSHFTVGVVTGDGVAMRRRRMEVALRCPCPPPPPPHHLPPPQHAAPRWRTWSQISQSGEDRRCSGLAEKKKHVWGGFFPLCIKALIDALIEMFKLEKLN